jgi:transcriptional regulator with XRE-family HTH domain
LSPRLKEPLVPHIEVGSRVREARLGLGLTQHELAAAMGSTRSSIADVERGEKGISLNQLRKLCRALAVSPNTLVGEEPPPSPPLEDRRLLRRLQQAQRLSRRQKLALLKTIDDFLARTK